MLLTKEVEIGLSSINIKHFENLGYKLPKYYEVKSCKWKVKRGTKLIVPVDVLPKTSKIKVKVLCDYCIENGTETIIEKQYGNYLRGHKNGKDSCYKCRGIKVGESSILPIEMVYKLINNINYTFLKWIDEYKGTTSKFLLKCDQGHEFKTNYIHLQRGQRCPTCYHLSYKGSNVYNWKGGVRSLQIYLRQKIEYWKKESLKKYDYKCFITDKRSKNLIVHHIYNFSKIVDETLEMTQLPLYENVGLYSEKQLSVLENVCIKLHYKYGLGIPILKNLHEDFHKLYGITDNSVEQLYRFKNMYFNGNVKNNNKNIYYGTLICENEIYYLKNNQKIIPITELLLPYLNKYINCNMTNIKY